MPGRHAEIDAILKLKTFPKGNKKLININLMVIRTTAMGKLGNSKPCYHCIQLMNKYAIKKGYLIKKVIYSNSDESLTITTHNFLINEKNHHYSRYYSNYKK